MECAAGSDVALRADLLRRNDFIIRLHILRLRMQYFDLVARGLLADRVPLLDDDAAKSWVNLRNLAINRRCNTAVWQHATPTVHVETHMGPRADVPVSAEIARSAGSMPLFRRLDHVHEALNYGISRHAVFSITTYADIGGGQRPHLIGNEKP